MSRHRVAINLVVFLAIFVTMIVWSVQNVVTVDAIERPYELTADFTAASGILPRAEVAYLGVHYGTVASVDRRPGGVRVTMKIDRDRHIPEGSTANAFRKSAVGEPYIDFFPPEGYDGDEGPFLEAGDNVPVELTTTPLEFSELLRSASRLVSGIDPERLDVLIGELAVALNGRGEALRRLTVSGDQLAATFAGRTELLDRFVTNNTRLTSLFTDHRRSFGQTVTDLSLLAESLRNASGDTERLLEVGGPFLTAAGDLVAANRGNLDCVLGDLEAVLAMAGTPEHVADLRRMLDTAPAGYGAAWNARDVIDGDVWVRVGNITNPNNPARQYTPPIPVPSPPAVPACSSPLAPAGSASSVAGQAAAAVPVDLPGDGGGGSSSSSPLGYLVPGVLVLVVTGAVVRSMLREAGGG